MSNITTRPAMPDDAPAMCCLLNTIIAKGGTTAHTKPFDVDRMISHYITVPNLIACTVALHGANIVGYQWLERADPDWQGDEKLPEGWSIIASFVSDGQQGKGIGGRLFDATVASARTAGISHIDATIRKHNLGGLKYYSRMGFVDYRETEVSISKKFTVTSTK